MKILYEPWNLGDAVIAASVAAAAPDTALACNSRWHEVLRLVSDGSLRLIPLDLPYVWRSHRGWYRPVPLPSLNQLVTATGPELEVVSIRGDLRDLLSARRSFPGARYRFSGWYPYLARWVTPLDLPFRLGLLPVRNRYRAWAKAVGIPFPELERLSQARSRSASGGPVLIHLGAQWRSKQYPRVAELVHLLGKAGHRVELLAGPDDPLPAGLDAHAVTRPSWPQLVDALREARCVITNDSGPMHLAGFLGCRTLALSRCSNVAEWLPPGVRALSSPLGPRGYHPVRSYWSDRVLPGWPSPEEVCGELSRCPSLLDADNGPAR